METRWLTKDGEVIDVLLASTPIDIDDLSKGVTFTALEITHRKQAEKALRQRAQELTALNKISTQISRSLSLEQVIPEAVQGALEATDATTAFLLMRKGDDLVPLQVVFGDPTREVLEFPMHKLGACLCGLAVAEERAIYSDDIDKDPRCTWDECKEVGLRSAAALPLFSGDDIIAVLGLGADTVRDFESQAEFLETISNEVASGLQNAILFDAEAQRRSEAESLRNATAFLTASLELKDVLEEILDGLAEVIPYDSASIFMFEADSQRVIAGRGYPDPDQLLGRIFPLDDCYTPKVIETQQPLILPNASDDADFRRWGGVDYIRGWMVIPLVVRDEVIGRLSVDSRTVNAYNQIHADMALAFANQAAIAIDNARLFEQTQIHADQLEERVQERTAELQQVINLMAGREVRMAGLKKAIKKLRAQIKEAGMTPVADDPLNEDMM